MWCEWPTGNSIVKPASAWCGLVGGTSMEQIVRSASVWCDVWCGVVNLHEKCSTSVNLVWYSVVWVSAIFTQSD